jgi:hypothetical protein
MRQVNPNKASKKKTTITYYQNDIKHGMKKSKPQSKQAPFCTTFLHETFSLFQHHSNLFKTTFFDEY